MEKAYEAALKQMLKLLKYRDYSVADMETRLAKKGFDDLIIRKAVEFGIEKKYLDDERVISRVVEKYSVINPSGIEFIKYKLKEKGIEEEKALIFMAKVDEEDNAIRAAKIRMSKKPKDKKEFSKEEYWYKYLTAKGFNYDIIDRIIHKIKEEE